MTKSKGKYVNVLNFTPIFLHDFLKKINIWDFSGYKEFAEVRNEFYKECDVFVLVYDVTSRKSFENLEFWIKEGKKSGLEKPVTIVCGTKSDLSGKREIAESEGRSWASSKKFRYFEVSSKDGKGISEMFIEMVSLCIMKR